MWGVALIFIAVTNCNAELCRPQTDDLPETASGDHRIIGGSDTTIEKYPYAVQILVAINENSALACGGTLVKKSHVLTAAHCFFYEGESFERRPNKCLIREGTTYWDKGGTVHRVTALKVHEYYDIETLNFDVAVVLMTTPVDYSVSVARAINLPDKRFVVPNRAEVIAVGWGTNTTTKIGQTDVLQEVKLRKFKRSSCDERFQWVWGKKRRYITENMMCAGTEPGGKGICQGDSGGPLFYKGEIVGISSWVFKCAAPHIPGVFADVVKLHYWIRKTINALSQGIYDDDIEKSMNGTGNGTNPGGTTPGCTGSLSSKIRFATVLAPILYFMLSV